MARADGGDDTPDACLLTRSLRGSLLLQCGDVEQNPGPHQRSGQQTEPTSGGGSGVDKEIVDKELVDKEIVDKENGPSSRSTGVASSAEETSLMMRHMMSALQAMNGKFDHMTEDVRNLRDGYSALQEEMQFVKKEVADLRRENEGLLRSSPNRDVLMKRLQDAQPQNGGDAEGASTKFGVLYWKGFAFSEHETPSGCEAWQRSKTMDKQQTAKRSPIGIIGIPFSKGQPRGGTEHGPAILRENGLVTKLEQFGNKVIDYGDISLKVLEDDKPWNNVKNPRTVGNVNKQVADWVAKITRGGEQVALTLGGDHSLAIGSVFGHCQSQPDTVMVWVDAHADLNTPLSSPTGNIHGMPLSFVLKEMQRYTPRVPGFEWCQPCLSVKDLVYIGLRDVDESERAFIAQCGIACFSMQEIDEYGMKDVMDRALKTVDPSGRRPIHLSFDVDALDPDFAPSTGTPVHWVDRKKNRVPATHQPEVGIVYDDIDLKRLCPIVPGGLTRREMYYIAEQIAATGRLSALDVVEVNPTLGNEEDRKKTVRSTVDVVAHFFGQRREGNVSTNYQLPVPKN